jgi:hypothetical protein
LPLPFAYRKIIFLRLLMAASPPAVNKPSENRAFVSYGASSLYLQAGRGSNFCE